MGLLTVNLFLIFTLSLAWNCTRGYIAAPSSFICLTLPAFFAVVNWSTRSRIAFTISRNPSWVAWNAVNSTTSPFASSR